MGVGGILWGLGMVLWGDGEGCGRSANRNKSDKIKVIKTNKTSRSYMIRGSREKEPKHKKSVKEASPPPAGVKFRSRGSAFPPFFKFNSFIQSGKRKF